MSEPGSELTPLCGVVNDNCPEEIRPITEEVKGTDYRQYEFNLNVILRDCRRILFDPIYKKTFLTFVWSRMNEDIVLAKTYFLLWVLSVADL